VLAIDTNVLVRLLVVDDEGQQQAAAARMATARAEGVDVLVADVVVAEVSWVLDAVYGYRREQIADAVEALTRTEPFAFEDVGVVRQAVALYRSGPADLSDYLIVSKALQRGAERVLTFDRRLSRHAACEAP
jgi:predicted nucleic-acid-binding protein